MVEFKDIRGQLQQARVQKEQTRLALFMAKEKLKKIEAEQARLDRIFNKGNEQHIAQKNRLESLAVQANRDVTQLENDYIKDREFESGKFTAFSSVSDPMTNVSQLSDNYPFLLLPVRIETRFKTISMGNQVKHQLWVRIFPDDCCVDAFEPVLSEVEVKNAQSYWAEMWKAGGIEDQERGAWRVLVGSHQSGRAAWIVQQYQPLNIGDKPQKSDPNDIFLVITTDTPLADPEKTFADEYWAAIWLADGDKAQEETALNTLISQVTEVRAREIIEHYQPVNLAQAPSPPLTKTDVSVSVATVVFPKPGDMETTRSSWTQAAKVNIMPDRFVLMGYIGDEEVITEIGNAIPSPLIVGPDPSADPADQLRQENDEIVVNEEMNWMVDFDRAVETGMGFKIDLTAVQARQGFDRLVVLGLRLGSDELESKTLLETLIHNHQYSGRGFSILPQGTPTNNTDDGGSGFSQSDDADASFDDFFIKDALFQETDDWLSKKDGQWLAQCLGIDNDVLKKVRHSGGTDQCEARAMNIALWPATGGYFMDTMMDPVFNETAIDQTRWFFNHFVSGRGMIPAVRIDDQPYGILPTTVFSRMQWVSNRSIGPIKNLEVPNGFYNFRMKLYEILSRVSSDWSTLIKDVSYLGKTGDAHQILLDIIGLHPGSVKYYWRYEESLQHLHNRIKLMGLEEGFNLNILIESSYFFGIHLLSQLGYDGKEVPDILDKFFFQKPIALDDYAIIDDRPLSETEIIRNYTKSGVNYIQWLIDEAKRSLEMIRLQEGFIEDKPPTALLYLMLRHAIQLGYWDASIGLYKGANLLSGDSLRMARKDPHFIHIKEDTEDIKSRWHYLYQTEPQITGKDDLLIVDYIPRVMGQAPATPATRYLEEQINALEHLKNVPTARLERALAEHIDCCTYRLDAWKSGLINYQLAYMRSRDQGSGGAATDKGLYLGAYGWLEDVRPQHKNLTPVDLQPELDNIFNKPGEAPLLKDSSNAGYIHAPSLNHAVTAAVLRNGYLANATPTNPETLSVNLSSRRVRLALSVLEGIRNGQSLGALLGYRFERGLHDSHDIAEVDQFIYKLRKAFPLFADRFKTTETLEEVPIEAIEARNVIDGLALINHIKETGNKTYPFGKRLPKADGPQADAINEEVDRLMDLHDAVADLAMAEGVFQVVQGNYDRAAATLDAYGKANFPSEPDVVQTPGSGITLTHRVGLHLDTDVDSTTSPYGADIAMTPRAQAEPAVNQWLSSILPPPADTVCLVTYFDPGANAQVEQVVTQQDLQLQPLDLLYILNPESQQAMTELDDRVVRFIIRDFSPRPDTAISIKYIDRVTDKITFFELAPLIKSLGSLILRSRPLKASDIVLHNEADSKSDIAVFLDQQRIDLIKNHLTSLKTSLETFQGNLETLIADLENNREQIIDNIDLYIDELVDLLSGVGLYGIPQTGFGFAFEWKRQQFSAILRKIDDLVNRWQDKLDQFDRLMTEYDNLMQQPTATDEEKFELLQRAEGLISTIPTIPLPATPDEFKDTLLLQKDRFVTKKNHFDTFLQTATTSIAALRSDVQAQLPVSEFDRVGIDLSEEEKQILLFVQDISEQAKNLVDDLEKCLTAVNQQLNISDPGTEEQVQALTEAAKILLGEDFRIVPQFGISPEQGDEWHNAWNSTDRLLDHLISTLKCDFPVYDWLYGIARVHEKMHLWENITMLIGALGKTEPELHPIQLPYKANDSWLALAFPGDYEIDSDRLLYTAHYAVPFDKSKKQCGLLLDEWTEVIPSREETTGITFHYDSPNSEPAQVMLLVTPPDFKGHWEWQDLVDTLGETLEMAKQRAIEPDQLDTMVPYTRFLPATLMAVTFNQISISLNLAETHKAYVQLINEEDE